MKEIFISENIPKEIEEFLYQSGFSLRKLRSSPSLPHPVSSHADMLIFCDGDTMITQKKYYTDNRELFAGCNIITADIDFNNVYPKDIALNCFIANGILFGRLESICDRIKELYPRHINLAQGYAKCSTLLFDNCAVTADIGIAHKLRQNGMNVLEIRQGAIELPGYDYGFIGGASFVNDNKIIFFGDIKKHPDYNRIKHFIESNDHGLLYTARHPLIDLGGAVSCQTY